VLKDSSRQSTRRPRRSSRHTTSWPIWSRPRILGAPLAARGSAAGVGGHGDVTGSTDGRACTSRGGAARRAKEAATTAPRFPSAWPSNPVRPRQGPDRTGKPKRNHRTSVGDLHVGRSVCGQQHDLRPAAPLDAARDGNYVLWFEADRHPVARRRRRRSTNPATEKPRGSAQVMIPGLRRAGSTVRATTLHAAGSRAMCGLPVSSAPIRLVRFGSSPPSRPRGPCTSALSPASAQCRVA